MDDLLEEKRKGSHAGTWVGRAVQALSRMQKEVEIHGENDHFSVILDLSC